MFEGFRILLQKELLDFSRDKRTLRSMAGLLIGMPLFYVLVIGATVSQVYEQRERILPIGVKGCSYAQELCNLLLENRMEWTEIQSVDAERISSRAYEAILEIPEQFADKLANSQPVKLKIWYDEAEEKSSTAAERLSAILEAYQQSVVYRLAIQRGVAPSLLRPLEIQKNSIKPEKGLGNITIQLFMASLLMACFMSSYHLSIDSVAGERERQTLESLLQTAASREVVLLGKYASLVVVGFVGLVISVLAFKFCIDTGILQRFLGLSASLSWGFVGRAILMFLPLLLLATALQLMIGTLARSVKEAQTYTGLFSVLGFLPASFASMLEKLSFVPWTPNLGQIIALMRVSKEQAVDWTAFGCATGLTLGLTGLCLLLVRQRFRSESLFRVGI